MSTKSNYPDGRLKKESSHHRQRKDSSKGSTASPSPVSTAFNDSSSGSSVGILNLSLHPSSEANHEGVHHIRTTPVVVTSPSVPQDLLHNDQEYAFETFRFALWIGHHG